MHDPLREDLVHLTSDLIRFPSTADRPDQLAAVLAYAARYLASIPGLFVHRSERNEKPTLVATLRATRTPALMLNAHLDVVSGRPEQFTPVVRDGRIYGRAAQDMKGSAAVLLRLLNDLAALSPRPDIGVQFVTDEEIGGEDGTARLVAEGWRCGLFIAAEPTDLRICYEHKGGVRLEATLPGSPAHGSRPWEGRNPLHQLARGLDELGRRFPTPDGPAWVTTVTPTEIMAGSGARNQIPPEARLACDVRYLPHEQPAAVVAAVQACFPEAELRWSQTPPLATDPDSEAVRWLADAAAQVLGTQPEFYREHYGTDARYYGAAGIPAVCFGPVGAGLHSDEEWVAIDSLVRLYAIFRQLSLSYAG